MLEQQTNRYYKNRYKFTDREPRWADNNCVQLQAGSVDPMAMERSWLSPYNYVQNNPIVRIDLDGRLDEAMPPDDYGLDKNGNITFLRKTGDETDRLIVLDDNGKETNNSIEVDKGHLQQAKKRSQKTDKGEKDYTYMSFGQKDEKANELFEFLAENTDVEWAIYQQDDEGWKTTGIFTSHFPDKEVVGANILSNDINEKKVRLIYHTHSHPRTNMVSDYSRLKPSLEDKNFAKKIRVNSPNARFNIYFNRIKYSY